MRAALYSRVSTREQDVTPQLQDLREYAQHRGWPVTEEYIDIGESGAKAARPALDRLMADARHRRFDVVLVWRFDRFARSARHLLLALEKFRQLGIDFVSYLEQIDTGSPLGQAMFTIIGALAQFERELLIERVRAGLRKARADGKRLGRPRVILNRLRIAELQRAGLSGDRSPTRIAKEHRVQVPGSVSKACTNADRPPARWRDRGEVPPAG